MALLTIGGGSLFRCAGFAAYTPQATTAACGNAYSLAAIPHTKVFVDFLR